MTISRAYMVLSFGALLRDGNSFMGPALHGSHLSLPQTGGLRSAGCAKQADSSNLGVACSRPSLPRNSRGEGASVATIQRFRCWCASLMLLSLAHEVATLSAVHVGLMRHLIIDGGCLD